MKLEAVTDAGLIEELKAIAPQQSEMFYKIVECCSLG